MVDDLVAEPVVHSSLWIELLRPVGKKLLPHLSIVYRDPARGETERCLATVILADYAADDPQVLANLLMDADEKQFTVIYPKFRATGEQVLPVMAAEIDRKLPAGAEDDAKEKLAKRQANAAVALLKMNQPAKVWPLLQHGPDPRVRSYLIHRMAPLGIEAGVIVHRLDGERDLTIRRALLLALGQFGEAGLPPEERKTLLPELWELYGTDSDPGLHAAAEWLLRTWKEEDFLQYVNEEMGQGPAAAPEAAGRHPTASCERKREDAAAMVRQRPGADDGRDPGPAGIHDGIATHGNGPAG